MSFPLNQGLPFTQTVGHQVIHLYAEAMGLPLHRGTIKRGRSINTDLSYETTIDDEVEDLYRLLKNLLDPLEGESMKTHLTFFPLV